MILLQTKRGDMRKLILSLLLAAGWSSGHNDNNEVQMIRGFNSNNIQVYKFQDAGNDCYIVTSWFAGGRVESNPSISCVKR